MCLALPYGLAQIVHRLFQYGHGYWTVTHPVRYIYTDAYTISDVSGGYSSSVLDAMRCALHTSKAVWFKKDGDAQYIPLTLHEVLYMATMGGASGENYVTTYYSSQGECLFSSFHSART